MEETGIHVLMVGWLSGRRPFPRGAVPDAFLSALKAHAADAWQLAVSGGVHDCEFCPPEGPFTRENTCNSDIWIPDRNVIYRAPRLIVHYIQHHEYRPPDPYMDAVRRCAVLRSGPAPGLP
jgi:hypothetical protein